MAARHAILYDTDCGFCRWSLNKILAWDRNRRLRPVAIQSPEGQELLAGVGEDQRLASWHLVGPDGVVRSAGAGAGPLARLLPGGRPLAAAFERFPRATDRAYRWVAGHRSGLARTLRTGCPDLRRV
jgi:predicted DCC family thiol-disulfide oxidoreductase YuxK